MTDSNMDANTIVITDFALALYNGNVDEAEVRMTIKKMHKARHFSVIVPERFVRFIKVPHTITTITPPNNMTSDNERIAYQVYANTEAVVCTKRH